MSTCATVVLPTPVPLNLASIALVVMNTIIHARVSVDVLKLYIFKLSKLRFADSKYCV